MSSLRNKGLEGEGSTPVAESHRRDAYLDAARDCILDVGWRRTTLTEVARRAGVSRMTMYRAWPDMSALIGDLMTREWTHIAATAGNPDSAAAFADTAVALVRAMRDNDLLQRIVELDPDVLLPYLLTRRGRSQELLLELIESVLRQGQADGWARAGDASLLARSLVLAAHGFALSTATMVDAEITADDLDGTLYELVLRMVQP